MSDVKKMNKNSIEDVVYKKVESVMMMGEDLAIDIAKNVDDKEEANAMLDKIRDIVELVIETEYLNVRNNPKKIFKIMKKICIGKDYQAIKED